MKSIHRIDVHGIRLYANHGCMEEEAIIGTNYEINVSVWANLTKSAHSDDLMDTVDYVSINKIVEEEMAIRAALLEVVVRRISERIMEEHPMVQKSDVSVAKLSPPINGDVDRVAVVFTLER